MNNTELNEAVARRLGKGHIQDGWEKVCVIPDYAGSIEAAWEVVDYVKNKLDPNGDVKETAHPDGRMRFVGHGFRLEHHTENTEEKWVCALPEIVCAPPYEEMNDTIQAEANTAPRAICLAFLKLGNK